ncbi:UNVERIFIED_CONTAM: hypothetical protein Sradi_5973300 [Sesamum radiatum]|uniref:Senescence regulator n=1 Tax=Sesamum radiatum TaxID=300843 RepID=A0AAW2KI46_SESRA
MAEEFEESQVIFQEDEVEDEDSEDTETCSNFQLSSRSNKAKRKKLNKKSSVPVNIPENESRRSSWFRYMEEEEGDEGEMVPPHVIVGRRVAGKMMAFSVCTGNGRTLKGRDLSEVRNSVLRMTGFLET